MVKLIVGLKGSGKTKTLIDMANTAGETSNGSVVCIEKGRKLLHEIKYFVRLIDVDEYNVNTGNSLYGFVCGIYASNHDITDIFIDSTLKICNGDVPLLAQFVDEVDRFLATPNNINVILTASIKYDELPESLRKYVVEHQ